MRFIQTALNSPVFDGEVLEAVHGVLGFQLRLELEDREADATAPDDADRVDVVVTHHLLEVAHLKRS